MDIECMKKWSLDQVKETHVNNCWTEEMIAELEVISVEIQVVLIELEILKSWL